MEVKKNQGTVNLFNTRLAVFTGKGGVGKTSLATAFAVAAARAGKRVLLVEVRSPRRIPPLFGIQPEDDGPLELRPGIDWINLVPRAALQTYGMKVLKLKPVYRAVFEQRAVRRFLRAVPALAEVLILGHLVHLIEKNDYDVTVLDAPSTGPGAQMLDAPRAILERVSRGPMHEGAAWIQAMLTDPAQTRIHLVTVAEELPVTEVLELFHRIRDELKLPLGLAMVNRLLPDLLADCADELLTQAAAHELGRALAQAGELYRSRLRLQETYLDRLRAGIDLPILSFPEVVLPTDHWAVIDALTKALPRQMETEA